MKTLPPEESGSMTPEDFAKIVALLSEALRVLPKPIILEAPKLTDLSRRLLGLRVDFHNHAVKLGMKVQL